MSRGAGEIHQLKVTLLGVHPPIWRRLLVGSDTTLSELHAIVQEAMGWEDCHLHAFEVAGRTFGRPDLELRMDDESGIALGEIVQSGVFRFGYEYDFGDGWEHELVVEGSVSGEAVGRVPRVVAGRRACPPEDCGGMWGYAELLEVLDDPEDPEHVEKREWLGGDFDPEAFDLGAVNERLKRFRRGAPR